MIDTIGLVASCLTTLSFLPQAIRTVRTRDTSGISLVMYSMLCVGIALWTVYGWVKDLPPVWIGNLVTGCFASVVLVMKLREPAGTVPTAES